MNKYAQVALKTVELVKTRGLDPISSWQLVSSEVFINSRTGAKKGCPKSAFLGLCEEGLVKGIEKGNYTKSIKNKEYALQALELIKKDSDLANNPRRLWNMIMIENKQHNSQMDIVCELYKNGLLG
jgi:hypothetical protein